MAKIVCFDNDYGIDLLRGYPVNPIPNILFSKINDFTPGIHYYGAKTQEERVEMTPFLSQISNNEIPFATVSSGVPYPANFFKLKLQKDNTDYDFIVDYAKNSFDVLKSIQIRGKIGSINLFNDLNNPLHNGYISFYYFFTNENNFALVMGFTPELDYTIYADACHFRWYVFDNTLYGTPKNVKSVPDSSGTGGYNGDYDDTSDTIGLPNVPNIGVSNVGFVNIYKIDINGLQNLGSELFPDFEKIDPFVPSATDNIAQAIIDVGNGLSNIALNIPNIVNMYINNNLINYVLDCHILPIEPTTTGSEKIKIGFKEFSQSGNKISSDYVTFDCGTLSINEFFGTFLDYSPFTRCKLFLPFVGYVEIEEEFFQNGAINVTYRFNIIDGSFTCFVISTSGKSKLSNSIVKQFGGNCCVHIPLTGLNYSNTVSGIVASASGFLASSGNIATATISSALNVASSKPNMQSSNSYNATTSFLGVRYPYLIIERIVPQYPENYTKEKGITTEITTDFSNITGFTIAKDLHFDNILCTESEKDMISELFKVGVIL